MLRYKNNALEHNETGCFCINSVLIFVSGEDPSFFYRHLVWELTCFRLNLQQNW